MYARTQSIHQTRTSISDEHATPCVDVSAKAALWSHNSGDYVVPRTNLQFGERAFSIAAPRAWKRLPATLQYMQCNDTFRCHLKTFLFNNAYSYYYLCTRLLVYDGMETVLAADVFNKFFNDKVPLIASALDAGLRSLPHLVRHNQRRL